MLTDVLFYTTIEPLIYLFKIVILFLNPVLEINPVISLVLFSLIVNFLSHPVFERAEEVAAENRKKYAKMLPKIWQIKDNFPKREARMLLATYFRENNYFPPLEAFKQSLVLFLEIPFFIAAYRIIIKYNYKFSLGMDDLWLVWNIAGFEFRLLPVLMTLINFASLSFYWKNTVTGTEKAYALILPLVFLFFLYNSPSSAVLYWLFNNCFSLLRNVLLNRPEKFGKYAVSFTVLLYFFASYVSDVQSAFYAFVVAGSIIGIFVVLFRSWKKDYAVCCAAVLFLAVLCGLAGFDASYVDTMFLFALSAFMFKRLLDGAQIEIKRGSEILLSTALTLLPVSVAYSVVMSDFSMFNSGMDVKQIFIYIFCVSFGAFTLYYGLLAHLFEKKQLQIYVSFGILLIIALTELFTFDKKGGAFSIYMVSEDPMDLNYDKLAETADVLSILVAVLLFMTAVKHGLFRYVNLIFSSVVFAVLIQIFLLPRPVFQEGEKVVFDAEKPFSVPLSKYNKNVIVLFMDRAIPAFFPMAIKEKPELAKDFDGFIFYPNSVSFAPHTYYSAPSLLGGYEYLPQLLQADDSRPMREKHNEALAVMPEMFRRNRYHAIVNYLPFVNYGDWSYPVPFHYDIKYYDIQYSLRDKNKNINRNAVKENMLMFDLLTFIPKTFKKKVYDKGQYLNPFVRNSVLYLLKAEADAFGELINKTHAVENTNGTFILFVSEIPHIPMILTGDYELPETDVDWDYDNWVKAYHVNMLGYKMLSRYFDRLKDLGVYDNTRIIVISDHGYFYKGVPGINDKYVANNNLLLVKDFNARGTVATDYDFMTTADLPYLAGRELLVYFRNPFTGRPLFKNDKENGVDIMTNKMNKTFPSHFLDPDRTFLYDEEVEFTHIDKEGIITESDRTGEKE